MLSNLSEIEKGYLFGLFEGDGYKFHDKKQRHYQIEFYLNSLTDKGVIKLIELILKKIDLKPNKYQDKRYNCKRIRVYSKKLFHTIEKNINLDKEDEFNVGYVSGLIDSEGYVNDKKRYIMIVNTNKKILTRSKEFLNSIGINSSISQRKPSKKDKKASYRMYISVSFKNLSHLSIKAGYKPFQT